MPGGRGPGLGDGDYVVLTVADTGSGISPEDLDKVMEPFFTTKDVGKGSGLGLTMVYGFAKQSNGAVPHRQQGRRGHQRRAVAAPSARPAEGRGGTRRAEREPKPLPRMSILLVDDHAEVGSTTATMLGDCGHEVFQAANGADALRCSRTMAGAATC